MCIAPQCLYLAPILCVATVYVMCCCEVSMYGRQFSCQYLDVLNNMMGFLVVK